MLLKLVVVGLGGFIGANLRYIIGLWVESKHFPLATFLINMVGCFGLALFATLIEERLKVSEYTRLLISTGFFGAFTTFSTFNLETLTLILDGKSPTALFYVGASVVVGLAAGLVGIFLASRL